MQHRDMALEWDAEGLTSRVPLNFIPTLDGYTSSYTLLTSPADGAPITSVALPAELGWGMRGLGATSAAYGGGI